MKQIKLEVGKTYRNRKGKEVKITSCDGGYSHPYRGSGGNWYTESGRWDNLSTEHPEDLIEEVPETRHSFALVAEALTATRYTFDIPEGVKRVTASQEGNRIIVEMVPEIKEPKPGDVMVNTNGSVYIFKEVLDYNTHRDFVWLGEDGRLAIGGTCYSGRHATSEEAQPLFDALKKAGKKWNPETMKVEELPKPGDVMVNTHGSVYIFKEAVNYNNHHHYARLGKSGRLHFGWACNPGRPATPEEAQPLWDALKKAGKRWNAETMQVEEIPEIDRIREWVERHLEDGHYNQEGIAEVIEHYLKHKEDEK